MPHFPKDSLHITSGGGQIVTSSGQIIWQNVIDEKLVKELIQKVEQLGGAVIFGTGSNLYCSDSIYDNVRNHPWKIDVFPVSYATSYEITLLSVVQINPDIKKYIKSIKSISNWLLKNSSGGEYFDICAKGVNKLTAARIWCRQLGLGLKDIMAVGDNENDYELISNVGYGVVMGNSPVRLKMVAKKVIGFSDEGALVKFLMSLLMRNKSHG